MKIYIIIVGIFLFLAGCGSLRVQVDVVNPEYVNARIADDTVRKTYRQILQERPGEFAEKLDKHFEIYRQEIFKLAQRYDTLAQAYPDVQRDGLRQAAEGLRDSVGQGSIFEEKERLGTELERQAQAIRESALQTKWSGTGLLPQNIRDAVLAFEAESKKLVIIQQRDVRELAADSRRIAAQVAKMQSANAKSPAVTLAIAAATTAVKEQEMRTQIVAQSSIIEGAELSNTEYAYVVASAPEEEWHPKYNEALGSGTMGNVDVVIRMNSTADFSVKGMRFDASTVAQVASKVMTQSLLIGAQMAGVPVAVATSGTQSGGDALSKQSAELAVLEQSLVRREALGEAQQSAIRAAARSILSVAPQLESGSLKNKTKDDPERVALHDSVQITIDALKSQLSMQDLQ